MDQRSKELKVENIYTTLLSGFAAIKICCTNIDHLLV